MLLSKATPIVLARTLLPWNTSHLPNPRPRFGTFEHPKKSLRRKPMRTSLPVRRRAAPASLWQSQVSPQYLTTTSNEHSLWLGGRQTAQMARLCLIARHGREAPVLAARMLSALPAPLPQRLVNDQQPTLRQRSQPQALERRQHPRSRQLQHLLSLGDRRHDLVAEAQGHRPGLGRNSQRVIHRGSSTHTSLTHDFLRTSSYCLPLHDDCNRNNGRRKAKKLATCSTRSSVPSTTTCS